jgi:hypothetical protein
MGCRKVGYKTEKRARDVLLQSKIARALHGSATRNEIRIYFCRECRRWHATSQQARSSADASDTT